MAKLKPCPFCGDRAFARKVKYYYEDGGFGMSAYTVQCTYCGVRTLEYRDEDEAIEAWNRRGGEHDE